MARYVRKFKARAPSMAPRPGWTIGEELSARDVPRAGLWFMAIFQQVYFAVWYSALLICFPYNDPLFFSCASWRLTLGLSMYAYMALVLHIVSHLELSVPRAPFAVQQTLLHGGFLLQTMGWVVFGLPDIVIGVGVVAACTCFFALLVAGLLLLWMWLVRKYGATS